MSERQRGRKKNVSGQGKPIIAGNTAYGQAPVGNGKNWLNTYWREIGSKQAQNPSKRASGSKSNGTGSGND